MPKISKLEALRQGRSIEKSPGVYARLNPKTKSIEYSTGEVSFVGDDPDYFPENEQQRRASLEKEKVEREIESFPLGKGAGEFAFQVGQKGQLSGGALDWVDRFTQTGEDYAARKQARQDVSRRISGESPIKSGLATATSFVPDIVATRGMSAMKAAPALTVAGSGSRVLDEPGEVAGEAAFAAGAGFLLDKGTQFLSKTAQRRGLSRQMAREAQEVEARNLAGAAEAEAENLAQRQAFQREQEWAQRESQARQHQFNLEKVSRENEMMRAKQAYEEARMAQSAEAEGLKQEYQQAQNLYKEELKGLPGRQTEAQRAYSNQINQNIAQVEHAIPKDSRINTDDLNVWQFYNNYIQENGLIGTAESRQMQKVFRTLFPNGKTFTPSQFAQRLRAVESAIVAGNETERQMLNSFKSFLGDRSAQSVQSSVMANEFRDSLMKGLRADLHESFSSINPSTLGYSSPNQMIVEAERGLKARLNSMSPQQLAKELKNPNFSVDLAESILPRERFIHPNMEPEILKTMEKQGLMPYVRQGLEQEYDTAIANLSHNIENHLASAELQATSRANEVRANLSRNIGETQGIAEALPTPKAPTEPVYPSAPQPPQALPQPMPPAPVGTPQQPIPRGFTPEQAPGMPQARGGAEMVGDFFERPISELIKGKGYLDLGPLGNVAKLKYLLGAKSLPLAGVYGAGRALTAPGATGEALRYGLDRGGMAVIVQEISSSIPSYQEGIILDPNDRKLAVSKIETNPNLGIEDKAQLQAYINRGKNLEKLIRSE